MTTITVPRETWDALREALENSLQSMVQVVKFRETGRGRPPEQTCTDAIAEASAALTAANAVSHQKPETTPAPEGGAITAENDDADMLTIAYMDGFDAGKKCKDDTLCTVCDGSGESTYSEGLGSDTHDVTRTCEACDGSGSLHHAYTKLTKQHNDLQTQITTMRAKQFASTPNAEPPSGWKLVPSIPTEDQWGGLARDMTMWLDMDGRKTAGSLFKHLERCGTSIPQWLRDEPEMKNLDHVPSKGTRVTVIYRAMLQAAPVHPGEPD